MNQRAFSALEVKGVNEERRVITGLATSPVPDRAGDIVDPFGAKYAETIPLFLYHDSRLPVGTVKLGRPTAQGIPFEASIPKVTEPGALQTRVDEAWQMVKYKLIAAVSIGFREIAGKVKRLKDGGLEFLESEILELSLVPIPMQSLATINTIKSFDTSTRTALGIPTFDSELRAALGRKVDRSQSPPGASGTKQQPPPGGFFSSERKGNQVKTISELREERTTKAARMGELMNFKKANDGTYGDAERAEYDQLSGEVVAIDDEIRELNFHAVNSAGAREVNGTTQRAASQSRSRTLPTTFGDKEDEFKGQSWVRAQIARALAWNSVMDGNPISKGEIAEQRWGKSNPKLVQYIKADVAGGGTGSGEWGAELAASDSRYGGDFIEVLRAKTLFDALPLRQIPGRVHVKGQDGISTGYWVGESKGIPVTTADFSSVELTPLKVAAIAVCSNELLRDSQPSAEMYVRDSLVKSLAQRVDSTFFSTTAASAGVSPAGLLNGLTANVSGGTTADDAREDIVGLLKYFADRYYDIAGLHFISTPSVGLQLQSMRNALGQREFTGVTVNGGELEGLPLHTGNNVGTGDLICLSPDDIWKIGDVGLQVSFSREAAIEQSDAPTGATDTPATAGNSTKWTSMYQEDSTAIRVIRPISYAKRRSTAVAYIGNAAYGTITSV